MTLPVDLVAFLNNSGPWAAAVGGRLYPIGLPQQPTLPAATYNLVSSAGQYNHSGPSVATFRVQFDVYATTYAQAHAVAKTLVDALNGWNTAHAWPAFVNEPIDLDEPPELGRFRTSLDAEIWKRR